MKKWARGLVVCAAAAVLSIGAACMAYAAEGEINVNGTGVVQADPDTADISLEISTDGKAAQAAQKETKKHFGNSIYMFTPIYIANYCENYCIYCGFNCHNKINRAMLNDEEIDKEINDK